MGRFDDLDLTQVPSLSPLPDGVYIGRIAGWDVKPTKTGNEKILWEFDVEEPAEAAQKVPKFYFDTSLVTAALWKWKDLAKACGVLKEGPPDPEDCVGKRVGLIIVLETTNEYGTRSKVANFVRAEAAEPNVKGKWEDVDAGVEAGAAAPAPETSSIL